MNTKTLSDRALSVIDQYRNVPYFNNKTVKARAALGVLVGKGSPREIFDEVRSIAVKNHVSADLLADASMKKLLVDNNLGIDCSGFSYYILNAESEERGKNSLGKHLAFIHAKGVFGRFMSGLNPVKNIDVETLADDKNSRVIPLNEIQPGDMITMIGGPDNNNRNHMLVIHQIEYQNFVPTKIHYSHVMAYPEDGVYGTGLKQGVIEVSDPEKSLLEQRWIEYGKTGMDNRIFVRAQKSKTELRRLKYF